MDFTKRRFLGATMAAAGLIAAGPLLADADIQIQDRDALATALRRANGGERLILAPKDYGQLDLNGARFNPPVTIVGGTFTGMALAEVHGLNLLGTKVMGSLYTRECRNLVFDGIEVAGGRFGLVLRSVQDSAVRRSVVYGQEVDNVRICANSKNVLFEDNALLNGGGTTAHLDLMQLFGIKDQGIPSDITIRRNFLWARPHEKERARQGLFITDPNNGAEPNVFNNILVEQNLIWASNKNTLVIAWAGENCVLRNNTLRGSGDLLAGENASTSRNLVRRASWGLGDSDNDVLYDDLGEIFPGATPRWQDQVPTLEMGDIGAVELIEHLREGRPHGLDLQRNDMFRMRNITP